MVYQRLYQFPPQETMSKAYKLIKNELWYMNDHGAKLNARHTDRYSDVEKLEGKVDDHHDMN